MTHPQCFGHENPDRTVTWSHLRGSAIVVLCPSLHHSETLETSDVHNSLESSTKLTLLPVAGQWRESQRAGSFKIKLYIKNQPMDISSLVIRNISQDQLLNNEGTCSWNNSTFWKRACVISSEISGLNLGSS